MSRPPGRRGNHSHPGRGPGGPAGRGPGGTPPPPSTPTSGRGCRRPVLASISLLLVTLALLAGAKGGCESSSQGRPATPQAVFQVDVTVYWLANRVQHLPIQITWVLHGKASGPVTADTHRADRYTFGALLKHGEYLSVTLRQREAGYVECFIKAEGVQVSYHHTSEPGILACDYTAPGAHQAVGGGRHG